MSSTLRTNLVRAMRLLRGAVHEPTRLAFQPASHPRRPARLPGHFIARDRAVTVHGELSWITVLVPGHVRAPKMDRWRAVLLFAAFVGEVLPAKQRPRSG